MGKFCVFSDTLIDTVQLKAYALAEDVDRSNKTPRLSEALFNYNSNNNSLVVVVKCLLY